MLARYSPGQFLRGDVIAGITVTAYLVPQVMAYSTLAGLPATAGLWAIVAAMVVYAFVGTSRQLSVGPESTTALMTATALAPLAAGDPGRYATLAATLALLVGALAVLGRVVRLGFIGDLLSMPVLVGYMAGVAAIMIASQLGKLTGVPAKGDTFVEQIRSWVAGVAETPISWPSLLLGGAVALFLVVAGRRWPRVPMSLVAVALATAVVAVFDLTDNGIKTVGPVPASLPQIGFPGLSLSDVQDLLLPALGIVLVGYADFILTARSFATRHNQRIDANSELLALGAANVGSAAVSGFPLSSSGSRTVIADASGARTQVYSLVAAVGVVVTIFVLGGLLAAFPTAALGGLVVYAALRLVDVAEFRRLWAFRRREFLLAVAATAGVLVFDILYGVLIAVGLSVADLLSRVARPHEAILGQVPGLAGWHDIDDHDGAVQTPGLVVYRYESPLFFANAEDFLTGCEAALDDAVSPPEWLLINCEGIVECDITGLDALGQVAGLCQRHGVRLALVRVRDDLHRDLVRHGVGERIGESWIFPTFPVALEAFHSRPGRTG